MKAWYRPLEHHSDEPAVSQGIADVLMVCAATTTRMPDTALLEQCGPQASFRKKSIPITQGLRMAACRAVGSTPNRPCRRMGMSWIVVSTVNCWTLQPAQQAM